MSENSTIETTGPLNNNPSNDVSQTVALPDAKNSDPTPVIDKNQDNIIMHKTSFVKGHLFLIISFIVFLALATMAIFFLKDKTNLNGKTSTSISSKNSYTSAEAVSAPAIPVEDEVVKPPAPPTE